MPIVTVQMWPGRTREQKAELIEVLTDDMVKVCGCPAQAVTVIIEEVDKDDWGLGGKQLSALHPDPKP